VKRRAIRTVDWRRADRRSWAAVRVVRVDERAAGVGQRSAARVLR
jgi:hypothetical protein